MSQELFIATIQLANGNVIKGPVKHVSGDEYLFVNRSSDLDLYFQLKKVGYRWEFSWGPSVEIPVEYIKQVGRQIDLFHHSPESIEQMADDRLHQVVSQAIANSLHFEFTLLPNTRVRVYYAKVPVDGGLYWRMQRFELLEY